MAKIKKPPGAGPQKTPPTNTVQVSYGNLMLTQQEVQQLIRRTATQLRYLWVLGYRNWQISQGRAPTYNSSVRWDGGVDPHTKKTYPCIWPAIAHYALLNNLNPDELVEAQFQTLNQHPTPLDLKSPKGHARYKNYLELAVPKFKMHLHLQKVAARIAIASASNVYLDDVASAYIFVLCDSSVSLSPLFRYCLACEQKLPTVARLWHLRALQQYTTAAALYDSVWGEIIPDSLRTQAVDLKSVLHTVNTKGIGNGCTISSDLLLQEGTGIENDSATSSAFEGSP